MTPEERDICIKNLLQNGYVNKYYNPKKGIIYGATKLGYDMASMLYPLTTDNTLRILPKLHPHYNMQNNLILHDLVTAVYDDVTKTDVLMLTENGIHTITVMDQLLDEKYQKRQRQKEMVNKVMGGIIKGMASIVDMSQKTAAALSKLDNSPPKKRRRRKYDYDDY